MIYYRVIHFFITKEPEHIHRFDIGIYDSKKKAIKTVKKLRKQEGFCLRPNNFYIIPVIRVVKPRLLNITYWDGGFFTYTYKKDSLSEWIKNKIGKGKVAKKELADDKVRVIKISKEALYEFIYENFIDGQEAYLDVDALDVTNSFDINFETGEFIFCVHKTEDKKGKIIKLPEEIDLQQLIKNIPNTTNSMYDLGSDEYRDKYREYSIKELVELSKKS